jgi:hypothetical protein
VRVLGAADDMDQDLIAAAGTATSRGLRRY